MIEDEKRKVSLSRSIPAFQTTVIVCMVLLLVYGILALSRAEGSLPAFLDMRLMIPVLDQPGRNLSALLIALVGAVLLFFYTILSMGKQKKRKSMRTRPVNQLIAAILADILIAVNGIFYMLKGGFPLAAAYALIVIIICAAATAGTAGNRKPKAENL